ncbi:acetyltransferase [uncultured Thiodictyon sp.]|jgi:sugar O-acyltransferase (sialic acid O-acetyltransferase NeuD family)|uniref:acetyltransferase n=1 Tax=uncultured Thiodictyon sp. TaxID=1846217 RepID=UPI0025E25827|nr:acetyltransferase [uncultured Thiodictyon sp.]
MNNERRPLVIFGGGTFASLAAHCVTHDGQRTVAAFTVDAAYARSETYEGLPLVAFETLIHQCPPETHDILVAVGYSRMNGLRHERCDQTIAMGYRLASWVSSRACVWPDLPVGRNVIIFEQAILQSYVRLGDDVIVRSGANIGHHSRVGSHTFVATGVVTGGNVTIGEHCFIGLGAVLRDGITIADRSFIGAGAVVVADTEADGVYVGSPARRLPNKRSLDIT